MTLARLPTRRRHRAAAVSMMPFDCGTTDAGLTLASARKQAQRKHGEP